MYIDCAVFENYRNISHFPFSFDRGINILYGKNGQGKTNVIEGLYLFGTGKSFRHTREKDLIQTGKPYAQISIAYVDKIREHKTAYRMFAEGKRELFRNSLHVSKMSEFIGHFQAVLFCPEHLAIVKSDPSERRSFLDTAISQFDRTYLSALILYKKLLEQRNALLRSYHEAGADRDVTLDILSSRLSGAAAVITEIRASYIVELFEKVNSTLLDMTEGKERTDVRYLSHIIGKDIGSLLDRKANMARYEEVLSRSHHREIQAGTTLFGPHRDDIEILINGQNAKIFGSQGQQRSIALAMKLAEGEISLKKNGEYPVFLLDDVLSELDSQRKKYILSELHGRQVILTTCDENDFRDISGGMRIFVEKGNYTYRQE